MEEAARMKASEAVNGAFLAVFFFIGRVMEPLFSVLDAWRAWRREAAARRIKRIAGRHGYGLILFDNPDDAATGFAAINIGMEINRRIESLKKEISDEGLLRRERPARGRKEREGYLH